MAVFWFMVAGLLVLGIFAFLIEKDFFVPTKADFLWENRKEPIFKIIRFIFGITLVLGLLFCAFWH